MMSIASKKSRNMDPEKIYDLLLGARTADLVTVSFKDGRVMQGAPSYACHARRVILGVSCKARHPRRVMLGASS